MTTGIVAYADFGVSDDPHRNLYAAILQRAIGDLARYHNTLVVTDRSQIKRDYADAVAWFYTREEESEDPETCVEYCCDVIDLDYNGLILSLIKAMLLPPPKVV